MKGLPLLAVIGILGFSGVSHGGANATLTNTSGPILAGQTASFVAQVTGYPTPGYDWEKLASIDYTFTSGDGRIHSGRLSGLQATPAAVDLFASFDYLVPGTYSPTFSARVTTLAGGTGGKPGNPHLSYDTESVASIFVAPIPIPEPETYAMLLAGLGLLALLAAVGGNRQKPPK